jgi:hypothetical protein
MINKCTAYHEAGHTVVWMALSGNAPHEMSVPFFGIMGGAQIQLYSNPNKPVPSSLKQAYLMTLLAGAAAQAKFQRRSFASVWNSWVCASDREAADGIASIKPQTIAAAQGLVRAYWTGIVSMAEELLEAGGFLDCFHLESWRVQWAMTK